VAIVVTLLAPLVLLTPAGARAVVTVLIVGRVAVPVIGAVAVTVVGIAVIVSVAPPAIAVIAIHAKQNLTWKFKNQALFAK
jgi:hypothetical protein